jgi:hypothetical protein
MIKVSEHWARNETEIVNMVSPESSILLDDIDKGKQNKFHAARSGIASIKGATPEHLAKG